jgi:hypothetical protein
MYASLVCTGPAIEANASNSRCPTAKEVIGCQLRSELFSGEVPDSHADANGTYRQLPTQTMQASLQLVG